MNLNDHAVKREVELAVKETKVQEVNLTRSAIAEGYTVNVPEKPLDGSVHEILAHLGTDQAASFTSKFLISKEQEKPSALGTSGDSIVFASDFIRKLASTYIGSSHTVPCDSRGGFKEGLQRLLTAVSNPEGTYGDNAIPQDDITNVLDCFDKNDIVGSEGAWYGLRHWIYLPITNRDINVDIADFHSFSPEDQTALRTAKMSSLSTTYVTIILKDGTQFILWPSETQFGIVAAYPKGN